MFAAANGVVIATEKKLPSILVDETSVCVPKFLNFLFCHILVLFLSQVLNRYLLEILSRCKRFRH